MCVCVCVCVFVCVCVSPFLPFTSSQSHLQSVRHSNTGKQPSQSQNGSSCRPTASILAQQFHAGPAKSQAAAREEKHFLCKEGLIKDLSQTFLSLPRSQRSPGDILNSVWPYRNEDAQECRVCVCVCVCVYLCVQKAVCLHIKWCSHAH